MQTPAYPHLHVHSHFTLLGGTASVPALVQQAAAYGLPALALTDTAALYGAVAFSRACQAAAIQPISGMVLPVAAPAGLLPLESATPGLLLLLATGPAGYPTLCRLTSLLQGSPQRDRLLAQGLPWAQLAGQTHGLLALDGGRRGWLARYLHARQPAAAAQYAAHFRATFGDNGYLSLELHRPQDAAVAEAIVALGQRHELPAVAVQPIYCLTRPETATLRLLAAIDQNCPLSAVPPAALPNDNDPAVDVHWLSPAEMAGRFAAHPDALAQIAAVVARCQPALPDGRPIWPALPLPAGEPPATALAAQAAQGLTTRYGPDAPAGARARLHHELTTITRHGFDPLFLVVADIVRFARQQDIPVNTRGSVANSLVAYCLGITSVDPLAHDLLFERFLNPARANPPDIDLDFCSRRRDQVLAYVRRTYGADRVALVATVSTLRPKSAVRETAKAYGLDEAAIKSLTARLPRDWHPDPRRRERRSVDDLLAEIGDPRQRAVIQAAYGLLGQPHHLSIHPGGLVITPGPLTDYVPVQLAPKGFLITQFGHEDVAAIGLPKLDLLGIRALTVLADAAELVRAHHDPAFRLAAIPPEDAATGDMLAQGATIGVFQCESSGAQRTLRQLKARTVRDLAVANAFFKPGPATGGMAQAFIRRYRGEAAVTFLHPALAPILQPTQGVLLFQEQVLRVAREIAGLSWAEADHLRRGMSKFQAAEMAAMQARFVAGCCQPAPAGPAFTPAQAERLWEQVMAFAGYGFNQGHATAYADVSYRSAYLKAHWPAPFLCARLADAGGFHHPAVYMAEAVRLGIGVRPPHVNVSGRRFTLTQDPAGALLWMGLGQVRDLRREAVRAILAARRAAPFASLRDLLARVPLQAKEVTHLVQCGALDGLGAHRAALLAEAQRLARAGNVHQLSFDFGLDPAGPPESPAERLAWEQQILGWPVSVSPLALVPPDPAALPLARLPEMGTRPVTVLGYRLPGWTGGPGFWLGDGQTLVVARLAQEVRLHSWQPLRLHGQWRTDPWGGGWFQATGLDAGIGGRIG